MKEKSSQFDEKGMKVHQQIKSGNTVQSRYSDTNYKDKIPIRKNMLVKFMDKALKKWTQDQNILIEISKVENANLDSFDMYTTTNTREDLRFLKNQT